MGNLLSNSMTKESLIASLITTGKLKTGRIIDAFKKIDRRYFVPESLEDLAYEDSALPIGFGQTISQPSVVAMMLEWLRPKKGHNILEIGSGSGWTVALLSEIVGPKGRVTGLERIKELADFSREGLRVFGYLRKQGKILHKDGFKGLPDFRPYDRILVSASVKKVPKEWKYQLKINGRLVLPTRGLVIVIERASREEFRQEPHFGFVFVPLVND